MTQGFFQGEAVFGIGKKIQMPDESEALPGRSDPMPVADVNRVTLNSMTPPFPSSHEQLVVGMGCFWGVERLFYSQPGVWTTAVGYSAGLTPNPTYEEVCSGLTGHNEVVLIVYDPSIMATEQLLSLFWENHDPTQGMRQGPDRGTQYRSGIYTFSQEQMDQAVASRDAYQQSLAEAGFGTVTTEILSAPEFYYAEDYHQQYLHKNPAGYCSMRGTGIQCGVTPEPAASVVE